jgi:3-oxoacyl-[acyl-carrier protein] reductase
MNLELTDKVIVITGGTRGLGRATAELFLEEGATVIILARNRNYLNEVVAQLGIKHDGGRIRGYAVDCTNSNEMDRVSKEIISQYGRVDGLVANVGDGVGSQEKLPNEVDWQVSWQQNFDTAIIATRVFLHAIESSHGSVVYVSSIAGMSVIGAPLSYSTAKSALISLAKNLAVRIAPKARINVVAPGNIIFPGGVWRKKLDQDPIGVNALINRNVPMKRFGESYEVAQLIVFLCSTKASFITGVVVPVDGGQVLGGSHE